MAGIDVATLGAFIREQRETASLSLRELSLHAGVSNPYLSQVERGLKKPSAEVLAGIAKGLRISAEALYVRAGLLEERVGDDEVRRAILADPVLSERQKTVLLDLYSVFVAESRSASGEASRGGDKPVAPVYDVTAEQRDSPVRRADSTTGAKPRKPTATVGLDDHSGSATTTVTRTSTRNPDESVQGSPRTTPTTRTTSTTSATRTTRNARTKKESA